MQHFKLVNWRIHGFGFFDVTNRLVCIASKSGVLRTKTSSLMSWVAVVLIAFVLVPWLTSVKAKHPNAFPIKEYRTMICFLDALIYICLMGKLLMSVRSLSFLLAGTKLPWLYQKNEWPSRKLLHVVNWIARYPKLVYFEFSK